MLTQTFFTSTDSDNIQNSYKKFRALSSIVLIVGIPVEAGIAWLASLNSPNLFWPILAFGFVFLFFLYYIAFFKRLKLFRLDLAEQTKLVGTVEVLSKSEKEKQCVLALNAEELKQVALDKKVFDKINTGDNLLIEFSRNGKYIFKMSKESDVLINN